MTTNEPQLPQVAFTILLALSLRERHGYEIIKQIEEDSEGRIKLGPGALYSSIKQLLRKSMIAEVKQTHDPRRRYYKLTGIGMQALQAELQYYENAIAVAKKRQVLNPSRSHA